LLGRRREIYLIVEEVEEEELEPRRAILEKTVDIFE